MPKAQEVRMYMDSVVLAGIVTVLLLLGFFVGVGVFIVRDQKVHGKHDRQSKAGADKAG
jgi:hypothetical protein